MREAANVTQADQLKEQSSCSICLEDFDTQDIDNLALLRKCGHIYHHKCIKTWIQQKVNDPSCPYCKTTL